MDYLTRDQSIALAYGDMSQSWTLAQLAALYGLSRQRLSQIVATYCPHVGRRRVESRADERSAGRVDLRGDQVDVGSVVDVHHADVEAAVASHPGGLRQP